MGKLDKLFEDRSISTKAAANILGSSQSLISKWCNDGFLGAKVGGRYYVDRKDLDAFTKKRGNPNFQNSEYQEQLAVKRRDHRISSQEAEKALETPPEAPAGKMSVTTGGIMMGRKRS